eukprot:6207112-Pleurochrysis_carterae.AAC.1
MDCGQFRWRMLLVHAAWCVTRKHAGRNSLSVCLLRRRYTGFIPGGQHQMAKTYGHASQDAMTERQANDDPQKWRKFVSYAEFTPAHTPAEEHHIPGYSGHVPGVYSENLYAKTYGKTTLQAVRGSHAKGCEQDPDEQYRTSTMTHMGDTASHPGKPQDIMPGGVSWTGASPYNMNGATSPAAVACAQTLCWSPSSASHSPFRHLYP